MSVKIIRKAIKPPTLRAQRAVSFLLASPSKAEALRKAGYSPKTARVPSDVFDQPSVKPLLDKVVKRLEHEREKVFEHMEATRNKANYGTLAMTLSALNRDIELLSHRPTNREEYQLPQEEQDRLRAILEKNKRK